MDLIEGLEAAGLKPVVVDENTDISEAIMRRHRVETNEEFVVRIMNFGCPSGELIQAFVIEALTCYALNVAITEEEPAGWPELLSFDAWHATGVWLRAELEKKYGPAR